jgi:hypothetical protein
VAIQHDRRIVVVGAYPEVVAGVLSEEWAEPVQKIAHLTGRQFWTFVSTEFRSDAGRVQQIQ